MSEETITASDAIKNGMATAWLQGFLYAYYRERGYMEFNPNDLNLEVPKHLVDDLIAENPFDDRAWPSEEIW